MSASLRFLNLCVPGILVFSAVVFCLGCGKGSAAGHGKPEQPKDVADAAKLVEVGQCEAATDKLKAFISSHPEEIEAYLVLGDAWTCRAFSKSKTTGEADLAALSEAEAAYESAVKLAPTDERALVSSGAVALYLRDVASAKKRLEAAHAADAKNFAALNLLVLSVYAYERSRLQPDLGKPDEGIDPGLKLLAEGYALRKGADSPTLAPSSVCTTSGCGKGVFLESVTIDGQTYPAGTVAEFLSETNQGLVFIDKVHPTKKPGQGWVLNGVGELFNFPKRPLEEATVLSTLPPPRPMFDKTGCPKGDGSYDMHCNDKYQAWQVEWGMWGCGASGCRYERDVPAYEARLRPVSDVAPGSVKPAGELVFIEGKPAAGYAATGAIFLPVRYEKLVFSERTVDPKVVARVQVPPEVAATVVNASYFSIPEKRLLLLGNLVTGTPLAIGLRVRGTKPGSGLRGATLSLKDGEVTIEIPSRGGVDTYVNGELAKTTVPTKPVDDAMDGE